MTSKFVKEGEFKEKSGAPTLKLVGDVVPVDKVEVIQRVKENLTKSYPYSAMEMAEEVTKQLPQATKHDVWACVSENDLKVNPDYSVYNFRNKRQEDAFKKDGTIPAATPSIYNQKAVEFIVNVLRGEKTG